jgi:hypothetical protein
MDELNVYQKLSAVRIQLQNTTLKKTGKHKHYDYFQLEDFLPTINTLCNDIGLLAVISYGTSEAVMTITNVNKPDEFITIGSPMPNTKLAGGANEAQELGATQTYLRRYFYLTALEIVEHDELDARTDEESKEAPKREPSLQIDDRYLETGVINAAQVTRLCALLTKNNWDTADFSARLVKKYSIDSKKKIPVMLYEEICNIVERK